MAEHLDTLIIGGGQAGLAASYWLTQRGREHIVLEQAAHAANVWRNDRWDSFTLVTPNWMLRMPGAEYDGPDPDGFLLRDEVVAYLENYITRFRVPMRYNVRVESVAPSGIGYRVQTSGDDYHALNVIIATGLFQSPRLPSFADALPAGITQLHSGQYRNPQTLPPGAVLVVGSAQSGSQITDELVEAGRRVYLSTCGSSGRLPRRYRGHDGLRWFVGMGAMDRTVDKLPSPRAKFAGNPHVSGKDGGRTLNWHQFARDGVTLLGRIIGAEGHTLTFAPDLHDNLARADKFAAEFLKNADAYIATNGIDAPPETLPELRAGYAAEIITTLDLNAAGIRSVIWAMGYRCDYGLVKLPVTDSDGFPITRRGVTDFPGLYFLGLPWLHTPKSGLLFGVGEDAGFMVEHLVNAPR